VKVTKKVMFFATFLGVFLCLFVMSCLMPREVVEEVPQVPPGYGVVRFGVPESEDLVWRGGLLVEKAGVYTNGQSWILKELK